MKLLEGKVALITGAARGIGKAIALKYAQEGANIAFTDLTMGENSENTKKEIEACGVKVLALASNAADFQEAHDAVNKVVEAFGRVDILVNNAGITKDGLMMRMSELQWDSVILVNLKSAYNFIHAVTPVMMRQKYEFRSRSTRQCRTVQLFRFQGRYDRIGKIHCTGTRLPRNKGQCGCSRLYHYRYDKQTSR